MTLIGAWRDLGRPEAALMGAQYIDWYRRLFANQPYRVVGAHRAPWLFAGTGLEDGSLTPGYYGIEIDGTASASPPGTTVVATIPNIFPGETADMTYYTRPPAPRYSTPGPSISVERRPTPMSQECCTTCGHTCPPPLSRVVADVTSSAVVATCSEHASKPARHPRDREPVPDRREHPRYAHES
jgi:hypothetical protein